VSVHADHLAVSPANNVCCAGLILNQSTLSEIIPHLILHNLFRRGPSFKGLGGDRFSCLEQVKVVSGFTLADYVITSFERVLLEGVTELASFIRLHSAENVDLLEELLVHLSFAARGIFHNVVERISVQLEKLALFVCNDSCLACSVVEESELSKGFAWLVGLEEDGIRFFGEHLRARQGSTSNYVETVALIALLNNFCS
jgi:hypothetical protein